MGRQDPGHSDGTLETLAPALNHQWRPGPERTWARAQAILNACHQAREADSTAACQPAFTILPCTHQAGLRTTIKSFRIADKSRYI